MRLKSCVTRTACTPTKAHLSMMGTGQAEEPLTASRRPAAAARSAACRPACGPWAAWAPPPLLLLLLLLLDAARLS